MRLAGRLALATAGFLVVALPILWWTARGLERPWWGIALATVAAGGALAYLGGRRLARELEALTAQVRRLAGGRVTRLPPSRLPELDDLARAIHEAGDELAARSRGASDAQAGSAAVVDAMLEGVLATDSRGRIAIANPSARRLLGYGPAEPLPHLPQLFRVKAAREVVDAALRGEAVQDREIETGGAVLLVNARPLPSGGAILVLHDLTRLRRLEAVRRDFVANVSHELKTPLTAIAGYAESLLDPATDPATRTRFVETILRHAARMHALIQDQLTLARAESGRWQPRLADLAVETAVREAWGERADRGAAPGLGFEVTVQPGAERLRADPEALAQILGNLFDNSIRHTGAGGRIACAARPAGAGVALAVSDTGSGIPSDHLPRVFERYYRVDPARGREAGETGLGLAIVKHLVEAHGGSVAAESEVGRGTTITCWFPAAGT